MPTHDGVVKLCFFFPIKNDLVLWRNVVFFFIKNGPVFQRNAFSIRICDKQALDRIVNIFSEFLWILVSSNYMLSV